MGLFAFYFHFFWNSFYEVWIFKNGKNILESDLFVEILHMMKMVHTNKEMMDLGILE